MGVPKVFENLRGRIDLADRPVVGILTFEAAAAMARLVSLHRSLAEDQFLHLRHIMRSQGVAYLTSKDQSFLLRLACADILAELDKAATSVARLCPKCRDPILRRFDRFYDDIKAGALRLGRVAEVDRLGLGSTEKDVEKRLKNMEKWVEAASKLYEEMEELNGLEAAEQRVEQQNRHSGPIPKQQQPGVSTVQSEVVSAQRNRVRRLKEESLWSKSVDKIVDLMVRAVITVFARICAVFGPYVLGFPPVPPERNYSRFPLFPGGLDLFTKRSSGPIHRPSAGKEVPIVSNSAPMVMRKDTPQKWFDEMRNLLEAGPSTVGGSGLALRYANIIELAEKLGESMAEDGEEAAAAAEREELYEMLPSGMRTAVRAKLRECWRREGGTRDATMAEGWREAVGRILAWLRPVASDTLRWQEEHYMEQRFYTRPRALLLQTLHFADQEKTEAAIVEVLVGLSCAHWYREQAQVESSGFDHVSRGDHQWR
ncbi:protein PSK SIMULATOR 1-like [Curcuma longa]|uniref:protein PSK SIMULATOR 1-like n=1 Tax=Curcuma longa TaxID=136217 RepID=UPI003D9ECBF0